MESSVNVVLNKRDTTKVEDPNITEIKYETKAKCKKVTEEALVKSVKLSTFTFSTSLSIFIPYVKGITTTHGKVLFGIFVTIAAFVVFLVGNLVIIVRAEFKKHDIRKKAQSDIDTVRKSIEHEENTHESSKKWEEDRAKFNKKITTLDTEIEKLYEELHTLFVDLENREKDDLNAPEDEPVEEVEKQLEELSFPKNKTIYEKLKTDISLKRGELENDKLFLEIEFRTEIEGIDKKMKTAPFYCLTEEGQKKVQKLLTYSDEVDSFIKTKKEEINDFKNQLNTALTEIEK